MIDPMERIIADALTAVGIPFVTECAATSNLDFRLACGVHIEVKRMHTDRIAEQMPRVPHVSIEALPPGCYITLSSGYQTRTVYAPNKTQESE